MGKVNDQKRSEFLENDKIKQLGKVVVGKVNSYRELNDKIIETESEIETLQGNLKRMRNDLINQNQYFDDLRKKYSFGCSISQRKGTRSFNLDINGNRHYGNKKSISLGTETSIKEHLLKHLKNNPDERQLVERDWKGWIQNDSNKIGTQFRKGSSYERIEELIFNSPSGLKNRGKISKDTIFPI